MSRLPRGDQVVGEALSALRSADGRVAQFFLLRVLGRVVAGCGGIDCLHFLRGGSAIEPDALRGVARVVNKNGSLYGAFLPRLRAVTPNEVTGERQRATGVTCAKINPRNPWIGLWTSHEEFPAVYSAWFRRCRAWGRNTGCQRRLSGSDWRQRHSRLSQRF